MQNFHGSEGISIPALREEGDPQNLFCVVVKPDFYPRPPRGGRHVHVVVRHRVVWDFYPRPPRGGRLFDDAGVVEGSEFLSPPSARRATFHIQILCGGLFISIPALREEGDRLRAGQLRLAAQFLSPPSARRATALSSSTRCTSTNFYPRPPRGGRLIEPEKE